MADLDVVVTIELEKKVRTLALDHYGDASDKSTSRVANVALEMLLLFLARVEAGEREIDEPITQWDFNTQRVARENADDIGQWLFGRR